LELQAEWIEPRSPEAIEAGEPVTGLRVTVGQASALDMHRYRRLAADAWTWFWANTEQQRGGPDAARDVTLVPDEDAAWAMLDVGLRRAYMLATLRSVEQLSGETAELPTEWSTLEGIAQNCPAALFDAWAGAARECNPGLFWQDATEAGKRNGGASVKTPEKQSGR
jgi:hypothetical protein